MLNINLCTAKGIEDWDLQLTNMSLGHHLPYLVTVAKKRHACLLKKLHNFVYVQ